MQNTVPSNVAMFPAIKPGHRLVPARIARRDEAGVIAYIECPNWCDAQEHLDEPVANIEDVMHRGNSANVYVPTFGYGAYPIQMHAWIESDPVGPDSNFRAAHVTMQDAGGGSFSHLTPEMAEKAADEIVGFASQLRHLARTARLANQTTGDSDVDMDEALRRVREGQA